MKKNPFEALRPGFIEHFESSADRSTAIVGAANLDETLRDAIRSRLIARLSRKDEDRIFRDNGPLATFSAKIDVAYALGIVGKRSRGDLHLIRKIRNEFAHTAEQTRFGTHEIASRCAGLWLPANFLMPGERKFPTESRQRYRIAVRMLRTLIKAEQAEGKSVAERPKYLP
jgi:DNA-binding MltR family transcriptional regulator